MLSKACMPLTLLLLAASARAQVPVPNARQLDFMDLELTQFMCVRRIRWG
jgi:hypothetical protein